ncbi:MAG: hydroxyacid dehydrogenase [Erysipelothrix sp.]|nr:hydroxyacid dehydrogenase [Erysipelothrix sp.]
MKKIVVIEPLGVSEEMIRSGLNEFSSDYELVYYADRNEDPQVLTERAKDADILVVSNIKIDEAILKECKNLKYIVVAFTGFDLVDIEYCKANDIIVSNASGYATTGVVELVFGLILDLYRQITNGDKSVRNGGTHNNLLGFEIEGKKFGVVGAGAIGKSVAKLADAFNADVYVYNRSQTDLDFAKQVELEELFKTCDIISINLPLNDSTRNLVNKDLIDLMHKDAVIINTARGPIIDNDYLAEALTAGKIAGAGIDVFDMEPAIPSDYKLLSAPNTVLTPHVAYYTAEAMEKRFEIVIKNIRSYIAGDVINKVY